MKISKKVIPFCVFVCFFLVGITTNLFAGPENFTVAGEYTELALFCDEECAPGDPYRIIVYSPETLSSVSGGVETKEGNVVVWSDGFPIEVSREEGPEEVWLVLLGVPGWLPSSEYEVVVSGEAVDKSFTLRRKLTVTPREFIHEDIPLDKAMSDLRATPDPKKIEETKILLEIVNSFDPAALHSAEALRHPLPDARISSHFGDRRRYLYSDGGQARAIHFGIDLAKPVNTPVKACGKGKVVFSGPRIITGNTVILEHLPGVFSLYYHLHETKVEVDDVVEPEEIIGTVGSTGLVTGPHLHWEVRIAGVPVSPSYLTEHNLLDKKEIISIISTNYGKGR